MSKRARLVEDTSPLQERRVEVTRLVDEALGPQYIPQSTTFPLSPTQPMSPLMPIPAMAAPGNTLNADGSLDECILRAIIREAAKDVIKVLQDILPEDNLANVANTWMAARDLLLEKDEILKDKIEHRISASKPPPTPLPDGEGLARSAVCSKDDRAGTPLPEYGHLPVQYPVCVRTAMSAKPREPEMEDESSRPAPDDDMRCMAAPPLLASALLDPDRDHTAKRGLIWDGKTYCWCGLLEVENLDITEPWVCSCGQNKLLHGSSEGSCGLPPGTEGSAADHDPLVDIWNKAMHALNEDDAVPVHPHSDDPIAGDATPTPGGDGGATLIERCHRHDLGEAAAELITRLQKVSVNDTLHDMLMNWKAARDFMVMKNNALLRDFGLQSVSYITAPSTDRQWVGDRRFYNVDGFEHSGGPRFYNAEGSQVREWMTRHNESPSPIRCGCGNIAATELGDAECWDCYQEH
jgi:hypothetical protein